MAEAHKHKTTSWVSVALIVVASIVLAFAFVLQSVPLGIVGGLLTLAGVVVGITGGIMDDAH
ncbi:MAG TPA: hypothetical protein VNU66_03330 [Mycobacteriales bacterium]|nr:hypothetical protein [Mycobacteriales bacterium]